MSIEGIREWTQYPFAIKDVHFGKVSEPIQEGEEASFLIGINGQPIQQVSSSGKIVKAWPVKADLVDNHSMAVLKNGALWTTAQAKPGTKLLCDHGDDAMVCFHAASRKLLVESAEGVAISSLEVDAIGDCVAFAALESSIYLLFKEEPGQLTLKSYALTSDGQLLEWPTRTIFAAINMSTDIQLSLCPKTLRVSVLDPHGNLQIFYPRRYTSEYALLHKLDRIGSEFGETAKTQLLESMHPGYLAVAVKTEALSLALMIIDSKHGCIASVKTLAEATACWPVKSLMVDNTLLVVYESKTLFVCELDLPTPSMKRILLSKRRTDVTMERTHYPLSELILGDSPACWVSLMQAQEKAFEETNAKLHASKTNSKNAGLTEELLSLCTSSSQATRAALQQVLDLGDERGLNSILERCLLSSFEYPQLVSQCLEKSMTRSLSHLLRYLGDFQEPDLLRILDHALDATHADSLPPGTQELFALAGWEDLVSTAISLPHNASFMQQCLLLLSTDKAMRLYSLLLKWLRHWRETGRWSSLAYRPSYHQVMDWLNLYVDAFYPRLMLLPGFIPGLLELKSIVQEESEVFKSMGEMHDYLTFYFDRKNIRPKLEPYMIEIFPLMKQ